MKKIIIVPALLLATLQLNGALGRLGKIGRQFTHTLRSHLVGAQPVHLPATIQKACPAGMRLFSSSSRSHGGYSYAGGQQQASGHMFILGAGAVTAAALADKAASYYCDTPEERFLRRAQKAIYNEVHAAEYKRDEACLESLGRTDEQLLKSYAKEYGMHINPQEHNFAKKIRTMLDQGEDLTPELPTILNNLPAILLKLNHYQWGRNRGSVHTCRKTNIFDYIFNHYPALQAPIIQILSNNATLASRTVTDVYQNAGLDELSVEHIREALPLVIKNLHEDRPGAAILLFSWSEHKELQPLIARELAKARHHDSTLEQRLVSLYNSKFKYYPQYKEFINNKSVTFWPGSDEYELLSSINYESRAKTKQLKANIPLVNKHPN